MEMYELIFGFGAILLLMSIVGSGFEIKEIRLPKLTTAMRVLSALLGLSFIGLGLWIWNSKQLPTESKVDMIDKSGSHTTIAKPSSAVVNSTPELTGLSPDKSNVAHEKSVKPKPQVVLPKELSQPEAKKIISQTLPGISEPPIKKTMEVLLAHGFEREGYEIANWNLGEKRGGRRGKNGLQRVYIDDSTGSGTSKRSLTLEFQLGTERISRHADKNIRARIRNIEKRDLNDYTGIRFDIKSDQKMTVTFVLVDNGPNSAELELWIRNVIVDQNWHQIVIPFSTLSLAPRHLKSSGSNRHLDLEFTDSLIWVVNEKIFPKGKSGSIWLDNVVLYKHK